MTNDFERMWKEVVVAKFKVVFQHWLGRAEVNHENFVRIAGLRAEIWTRDLPNTKQDRDVPFELCTNV
jgi:hypothetical protein